MALASLVSVILLATLWSVASVSGAGFFGVEKVREASAQTPRGDQQEIGQEQPAGDGSQQNGAAQDSPPQTGGSDAAGYNEEAYAAFGDERNPFKPVLSQASEADAGGDGAEANTGDDGTAAEANTGDGGAGANANTGGDGGGDDSQDATGGGAGEGDVTGVSDGNSNRNAGTGGGPNGDNTVTASNGQTVDCSNIQDNFARITCEEERQAGDTDTEQTTPGQQNGGGQQGPPGSGGSGRSGAGDTADDFRNGGGGVSK